MRRTLSAAFVVGVVVAGACSNNNNNGGGPSENTGQSCTTAAQCYPGLDAGTLSGAVQCLDKVPNGYCTHLCTTDADCCAVPGECRSGYKQVCAPFESTGQMMCFLSCESADIAADAGTTDPSTYCHDFANASFGCRSTGGGAKNRQVCLP